jgi:hypothetical protein
MNYDTGGVGSAIAIEEETFELPPPVQYHEAVRKATAKPIFARRYVL